MQFTLLQHGESINADHHIRVLIRKDQWKKWYDEMMRRFRERTKEDKHRTLKHGVPLPSLYDVDESAEIGVIGIEHLAELLNFLSK